jgi:hypothetical protein
MLIINNNQGDTKMETAQQEQERQVRYLRNNTDLLLKTIAVNNPGWEANWIYKENLDLIAWEGLSSESRTLVNEILSLAADVIDRG